ncbi:MAG: hypothetical protein ABIH11_04975 [Candidatus Altiarchaeota archaeon]
MSRGFYKGFIFMAVPSLLLAAYVTLTAVASPGLTVILLNTLLVNLVVLSYSSIPLYFYFRPSGRLSGSFRRHVTVIMVYTNLALLMTYPLVAHLHDAVPGEDDVWKMMWYLWWGGESLSSFKNPYHTDLWFAPYGKSLVFHSNILSLSLLSLPLQHLLSLAASYNMLCIMAFAFSGYGMYLLVRRLTGNDKASLVSGLIFAFTPLRFTRLLGHLNLVSTQWIPFYILFLLRTLDNDDRRDPVLAGIFFALISATFLFQSVVAFIITLALIAERIVWDREKTMKTVIIRRLGFAVLTASVLISPLILEVFSNYGRGIMPGAGVSSVFNSADLLAYATPPQSHPILSGFFSGRRVFYSGGSMESQVFIGFTVISLSLLSTFLVWKSRQLRVWLLIAVIFITLSLGPFLRMGGVVVVYKNQVPDGAFMGDKKVSSSMIYGFYRLLGGLAEYPESYSPTSEYSYAYLPYTLVDGLPFMDLSRTPSRFSLGLIVAVSVLSGFTLSWILGRGGRPWLMPLITALILFESLALPIPLSHLPETSGVYGIIGDDPGDFIIHEKPYGNFFHTQTLHGKKILSGYVKSEAPSKARILSGNADESVYPSLNDFCAEKNVRYLIVHKDVLSENEVSRIMASMNNPPFYSDGLVVAYRIEA